MTDAPHDLLADRAVRVPLGAGDPPRVVGDDVGAAQVVGLGAAVRHAAGTVRAMQAVTLDLVAHHGVRAVALEGTDPPYATAEALDRYVTGGEGDPAALVAASQSFLCTREVLDVVLALRARNEQHPGDPVRIVHDPAAGEYSPGLAALERELADRVLAWRDATGLRTVYWGGAAHVIAGDPRGIGVAPHETHRSAGGHLRAALGEGYVAVAATVGAVDASEGRPAVPPVPASFTEAAFAPFERAVWVPLRDAPPELGPWLDRPLRTRMIGPAYDPERDADHHVSAPTVRHAVDAVLHVPRSTADTAL